MTAEVVLRSLLSYVYSFTFILFNGISKDFYIHVRLDPVIRTSKLLNILYFRLLFFFGFRDSGVGYEIEAASPLMNFFDRKRISLQKLDL